MALLRLDEAIDLGLLDPAIWRGRAGGRARFPGGFGSQAPFFRVPALTGLREPRFGLGPLLLRLGLSPQAPAFTGGTLSVPVGRRPTAAAELTPAQQVALIVRQINEGVIDPKMLPIEIRMALASLLPALGGQPGGQPGGQRHMLAPNIQLQIPPGPPAGTQELASADRILALAKAISPAVLPPAAEQPGADTQAAMQLHGAGERADVLPLTADELAAIPPAEEFASNIPLAPLTPEALEAGQRAETADLEEPQTALPPGLTAGVAPALDTLSLGADLAKAGQRFAAGDVTGGSLALVRAVPDLVKVFPETTADLGLTPGASAGIGSLAGLAGSGLAFSRGDVAHGAIGLAKTAPSVPALAKAFPEVASALGATDLVEAATPVLKGLGVAGGLAGAGLDFSQGNTAGGVLNLASAAPPLLELIAPELALPPPLDIALPVITAIASLFTGKGGGGPSNYDIKRDTAAGLAKSDLTALRTGQDAALANPSLDSALRALQYQTADQSTIPGRNPVRTAPVLTFTQARTLGFPTDVTHPNITVNAGTKTVTPEWSAWTTDQFSQYLGMYREDPNAFDIRGSGDVGYLPQAQAEATSLQAASDARKFLNALLFPNVQFTPPAYADTVEQNILDVANRKTSVADFLASDKRNRTSFDSPYTGWLAAAYPVASDEDTGKPTILTSPERYDAWLGQLPSWAGGRAKETAPPAPPSAAPAPEPSALAVSAAELPPPAPAAPAAPAPGTAVSTAALPPPESTPTAAERLRQALSARAPVQAEGLE